MPRHALSEIVIGSDELSVAVTPDKGCDIRQITLRSTGETVLWQAPWTPQKPTAVLTGDASVTAWLASYPGGWQLLLPNAGDPCVADDVAHGFHGEASMSRWKAKAEESALTAHLDCYVLPLSIERRIEVSGSAVTVSDTVTNTGSDPVRFMWGHHPGFGGDLLRGGATIRMAGGTVRADDRYDPPGNALLPAAESIWPTAVGREHATVDLANPVDSHSLFAYVYDLVEGRASIDRTDGGLGVDLSWDLDDFPCVWLWEELGGSRGAPWFGRGRVIGIEPCSTMPGHGLAEALAARAALITLQSGQSRSSAITLAVRASVR
jgi:galactose mutarotase-like enzyme